MTFALIATILSSIFTALMIIYDRLMITDCYDNKPDQAWFISSVFGSVFGLFITLLLLTILSIFFDAQIWSVLQDIWYPYGLWMIFGGFLTIQTLRHYFRIFIPEREEDEINETAIAMWIASTPVFVLFAIILINKFGLSVGPLSNLGEANVSWEFIIAVIVGTVGLIGFEKVSQEDNVSERKIYFKEVALMLFFYSSYTIILFSVMQGMSDAFGDSVINVLSLLLFYWLGFAAATRLLFKPVFRREFKLNLPNIKYFLVAIVTAEIIGMFVFFFESVGLSEVDPTLVNLIISASVLIVYGLNYVLRRLYIRMEERGESEWSLLGFNMSIESLPKNGIANVQMELIFLVISLIGITYATSLVI